MKIILNWRVRHYLASVGILFVTVALVAGMVGCGPTPVQYDLTISSTAGGSVTTPGEGTFTHDEGTVVNLVAEPDAGYRFVNWTGDVYNIDDVNATATNITMHDDYAITANFYKSEIRDWYDLDAIRNNLRGSYIVMNSLDSTTAGYMELASPTANQGKGWQPIGTWDDQFAGIFNGQGYEIRDLFINHPTEGEIGLFSYVGQTGVIQNTAMVNADVTGVINVGALVGYSEGTVSNSYATGSVTGQVMVGGLVGTNYGGTVSNCYATGNVIGREEYGEVIGGLVGDNSWGTVSNCYATGSVTGGGGEYGGVIGGLVGGMMDGTVSNSYSTGNVTGNEAIGGLVGYSEGTVSNSYATGSVTGSNATGGLVGYIEGGTVSNSFWDMETSGQATSDGGTGKNTTEMQDFATFSGAGWHIIAVALNETDPSYIWNIVNNVTYPFLSWQP